MEDLKLIIISETVSDNVRDENYKNILYWSRYRNVKLITGKQLCWMSNNNNEERKKFFDSQKRYAETNIYRGNQTFERNKNIFQWD